jgi:hypothetical protein
MSCPKTEDGGREKAESFADIEETLSEVTGLAIPVIRALKEKFKEEGKTSKDFWEWVKGRAAERGFDVSFTDELN